MDFIAAILELSAIWLIGNKKRVEFIIFILCNITWAIVAIKSGLYGLLLTVMVALVMNIRNWFKWKQK